MHGPMNIKFVCLLSDSRSLNHRLLYLVRYQLQETYFCCYCGLRFGDLLLCFQQFHVEISTDVVLVWNKERDF